MVGEAGVQSPQRAGGIIAANRAIAGRYLGGVV